MTRLTTGVRGVCGLLAVAAAGACAPRAAPLAGAPAPRGVVLPTIALPSRPERITFTWRYDEQDGPSARGDGVARTTPPDTATMTFFLAGGFGSGTARLTGDRLDIPQGDAVRRFLPAAPLLWAALGRLAVPPARDTVLRQSGDSLRADVGHDPTWRILLVGSDLRRVERVDGGRVIETLDRTPTQVVYRHEVERRTLRIDRTTPGDGSAQPRTESPHD